MVKDRRAPISSQKVVRKALVKRVSLSDTILTGVPNHFQWCSTNWRAVCSALDPSNFKGTRFTILVSCQLMVRMASYPLALSLTTPVTKSTEIASNFRWGTWRGWSLSCSFRPPFLVRWQVWQLLTYPSAYAYIPGHHTRRESFSYVFSQPMWPACATSWATWRRRCFRDLELGITSW